MLKDIMITIAMGIVLAIVIIAWFSPWLLPFAKAAYAIQTPFMEPGVCLDTRRGVFVEGCSRSYVSW